MTENQVLVLILVLIYLSECIVWVPHAQVAFQVARSQNGTIHLPGTGLGNHLGRLLLAHPIPMFSGLHLAAAQRGDLHAERARATWHAFRAVTKFVRCGGNTSFLLLFGIIPIVWLRLGSDTLAMLIAMSALLLTDLLTAFWFVRAHRRLYPEMKFVRWKHAALIALVPTHTARAQDTLARHALAAFHPLAVAAVALPEMKYHQFARRLQREAQHPLPGEHHPEREEIDRFLTREEINPRPPEPASGAGQYCPRCHTQFGKEVSVCADCRELPLVEFPGQ